jgi:hypothetical protein
LRLILSVSGIEDGMPFPIGLLVDGAIIRGGLASAEFFAQSVDRAFEDLTDRMWSDSSARARTSDLRTMLTAMSTKFVETQRSRTSHAREVMEEYGESIPSIDEVKPEDLHSLIAIEVTPIAIDVRDAQITIGGVSTSVGSLRVEVSHIAAWWPLAEEPLVQLNVVAAPTANEE